MADENETTDRSGETVGGIRYDDGAGDVRALSVHDLGGVLSDFARRLRAVEEHVTSGGAAPGASTDAVAESLGVETGDLAAIFGTYFRDDLSEARDARKRRADAARSGTA